MNGGGGELSGIETLSEQTGTIRHISKEDAMKTAQKGDTVRVTYTGKLNDGTVFDTSEGKDPLEFVLGEEAMIPGFERAVDGMTVGESRIVTIAADEAFGQRRDEMIIQVNKEQIPEDLDTAVGQRLQIQDSTGSSLIVTIVEITESTVTLDANHILAGQDLTFELQLEEIV